MGWLSKLFDSANVENYDPDENKCSFGGASNWSHDRVCPNCFEHSSHKEFMTQICLSCGQTMVGFPVDVATRDIRRNNKWVKQIRLYGINYLKLNGEWVRYRK